MFSGLLIFWAAGAGSLCLMALNVRKILSIAFKAAEILTSAKSKQSRPPARAQQPHRPAAPASHRPGPGAPHPAPHQASHHEPSAAERGAAYPGDYRGPVRIEYSPSLDGKADPGEVVWGWVPFEEDHSQGKDRPVLVIGHDGPWLLGLMLTSKDKNNALHHNPDYMDIGTGNWDKERRDSEVKLDRIIRIAPNTVRREGAILDRARFDAVVNALEAHC